MNKSQKNYYDVVIIGASFAGLHCAKGLANSDLNVLIVEKNLEFAKKTCGSGVEDEDLEFISQEDLNFPMTSLVIDSGVAKTKMPEGRGLISSINRPQVAQKIADELKKSPNIEIINSVKVEKILDGRIFFADQAVEYQYLVGADGSFSSVRNYLGLAVDRFMVAAEYIVPKVWQQDFLMAYDWQLFDKGYAWVFPNQTYTTVGAAVDCNSSNLKNLRSNLDHWVSGQNIDLTGATFEGFRINYDYKGYKFGNVFLAGDAAGLADGLTGKGIYAACLSGTIVAQEILGAPVDSDKLAKWLEEKSRNEKVLDLNQNFLELKLEQLFKKEQKF